MNSKYLIVVFILISIVFLSCSIDKEEIPQAKQSSISLPISVIYDDTSKMPSDIFSDDYYTFYPGSVYIYNSNIYLSLNKGIYSIDIEVLSKPIINYTINKSDFDYLNYNSPNLITADYNNNVYIENLRIEEKEITDNQGNKETILKKTNHRILKFDYEGNLLYSLGPNGKNDLTHFNDDETLQVMMVDEFNNLSIIIKKYKLESETDENRFIRENIDFYSYKYIKYDNHGKIIYTLDFSNLDKVYYTSDKLIRVIQDIVINTQGNMIIISTKDYIKKEGSSESFYIESANLQLYKYDLGHNKLIEKPIRVENDLFYLFGVSEEDKIYLCRPDDIYGIRFIVINKEGDILENKKIVIDNIRQKRYNFFFNRKGYISSIFLEDEKININQFH